MKIATDRLLHNLSGTQIDISEEFSTSTPYALRGFQHQLWCYQKEFLATLPLSIENAFTH
jgi:hypothetical protein